MDRRGRRRRQAGRRAVSKLTPIYDDVKGSERPAQAAGAADRGTSSSTTRTSKKASGSRSRAGVRPTRHARILKAIASFKHEEEEGTAEPSSFTFASPRFFRRREALVHVQRRLVLAGGAPPREPAPPPRWRAPARRPEPGFRPHPGGRPPILHGSHTRAPAAEQHPEPTFG